MKDDRYYLRDDGVLMCKRFETGRWVWYAKFPSGWGWYPKKTRIDKRYLKRIKYEDAVLELI